MKFENHTETMPIQTLKSYSKPLTGRSLLRLSSFRSLLILASATLTPLQSATPERVNVKITVSNLAPTGGTYLTPAWFGFHNGDFDSFNAGSPAPQAIERIAEDGNPAFLAEAFSSSGAGIMDTVLDGIGPIAPGASVSKIVTLDATSTLNRYFSFASMVIPSNDAFIANDDPQAHRLFDDSGTFLGADLVVAGGDVLDAGTEINDELPVNTALLGQMTPNTGENENGSVGPHGGFKSKGQGGILDDARFGNADFKAVSYSIARVQVELVQPHPVTISLTLADNAPEKGVYLTPIWIGFHDGSFDFVDVGAAASPALERLAEDGNIGPLSEAFLASGAGNIESTITSGGVPPVFAPGQKRTVNFTLDANDPRNQYVSFAAMVIPSNDAFVANDDPKAYRIFDDAGNVVGAPILKLGSDVLDAGTEINDEIPENTPLLDQQMPNTGVTEGGVVTSHPGFKSPGQGGILDVPMFANANFKNDGYSVLSIDPGQGLIISKFQQFGDQISLQWTGGEAPFQVQWRADLAAGEWTNIGDATDMHTASVQVPSPTAFLRVVSNGMNTPEIARYEITFSATWSAATHPMEFPSGPHFSGLIGATHSDLVSFWEPGGTASAGIEQMAETGSKSPLDQEIADAIAEGSAEYVLSGDGISPSPGSVSLNFQVSNRFPLVTLVSMIAPSPDWFVGVHGLNLLENGQWIDQLTVDLEPYDAGTDDGLTYAAPDADSTPRGIILQLTGSPVQTGNAVAPFGSFTFRKVN